MLKRFGQLPQIMITYIDGDVPGIYNAMGDGCSEADDLLDILDEIVAVHQADLATTGGIRFLSDDTRERNYESEEKFKIRTVWRFGSYVMFACTLDSLLARMHANTTSAALHWIRTAPAPAPRPSAEFEKIRRWRNKVFAHVAYAEPRRDDNLTDQLIRNQLELDPQADDKASISLWRSKWRSSPRLSRT